MRVLVATNMYPQEHAPVGGLFVQRQVEAVRAARPDWEVDVFFADTVASTARYLTARSEFARRRREFEPDVVHVHYGLTQIFAACGDVPKAVTFHGSDLAIPWQRAVSLGLLGTGTPVLVSELQDIGVRGAGAPVIPCGVDSAVFCPGERRAARRATGLAEDALIVGFPANPARPVKDHALFLRTVDCLRATGTEVVATSLSDVHPSLAADWMRAVDVVVLTSEREGSPVVTREALCCGTRLVTVDVGDVSQQTEGFAGCRVVTSREPASLSSAIRDVLDGPEPDAHAASMRFGSAAEGEAVAQVLERTAGGAR